MKKKSLWMRLLALMLVCGLLVGCLAGCGGQEVQEDEEKSEEKEETKKPQGPGEEPEDPREGLNMFRYQGLLVYLGDEMSDLEEGCSENEDGTMSLFIEVLDSEGMETLFGEEITSDKDLRRAMVDYMEELDSEDVLETGKHNDVYYLMGEAEDELGFFGCYYKDGYAWLVGVAFSEESMKATALEYATLCQIKALPDLETESTDDPVDDPVDVPTQPEAKAMSLTVWAPGKDINSGWIYERLTAFEAEYPEYEIHWDVVLCEEADLVTTMASNPYDEPDVYFYPGDNLNTLMTMGVVSSLDGSYRDQIINDNSDIMVQSVTYTDGKVYGFPVTPNTWFMYYNKSMFSESDVQSLETMLSKGKVALDWANGWYNAAFFFGADGTLFGPEGRDAAAGANFNAEVALKMVQLYDSGKLVDGGMGQDLAMMCEGSVGAMFSGYWNYEALKNALGDDLGVAILPTFQVQGQTYRMKAFAGAKAIGVNAKIESGEKAELAKALAAFLASADSQLSRLMTSGVTPVHQGLAYSAVVQSSPVAAVELAVVTQCAVVQPYIAAMSSYWMPMSNFGNSIVQGWVNAGNYKEQVALLIEKIK